MHSKSKTFVKGFIPKWKKKKAPSGSGHSSKKSRGGKSEVENLQHGAPPEGIPVNSYPPRPSAEDDRIEYDDNEPVEGTGDHGLFHHHTESPRPHWRLTVWEDVKVGDVVKIMDNESIPADILICATSEEENVAFIETKNLDGETNLKSRSANPRLTYLRNAKSGVDKSSRFRVDCDRPDTNLYKLNAAVVTTRGEGVEGKEPTEEKIGVDIQQMMLRGTVLRNTGWVIGVVLFTGWDTKIMMNSGNTPSKRSKVERQMNPQVYVSSQLLSFRTFSLMSLYAASSTSLSS